MYHRGKVAFLRPELGLGVGKYLDLSMPIYIILLRRINLQKHILKLEEHVLQFPSPIPITLS